MTTRSPSYLLLGRLRREYIITPDKRVFLDQPGGNLLYAAAGMAAWGESPGLVARVGEDYPRAWIEKFEMVGYHIGGIRVLPETYDLRTFRAYSDLATYRTDDPVGHFARLGKAFPKGLLGYKDSVQPVDDDKKLAPLSLRANDLPEDFKLAGAAHLCPMDFMTHSLMPSGLRREGLNTITLDAGEGYMNTSFWDKVPALLPGLSAFLTSEEKLRALFRGRSQDLWEMAEALASYACPLIVIKCGAAGQMLYDAEGNNRYTLPAYPARVSDPTGAGDAFCGGFLVGYGRSYDPLVAVMHGNVSASLVIEGPGAFFGLEALPGLAEARLEMLREMVKKE